MPVVALGFAVAPVAGQNFGARLPIACKTTFRHRGVMAAGVDGYLVARSATSRRSALVRSVQRRPGRDRRRRRVPANRRVELRRVGPRLRRSSMFQALGNTIAAAVSSFSRIALDRGPGASCCRAWPASSCTGSGTCRSAPSSFHVVAQPAAAAARVPAAPRLGEFLRTGVRSSINGVDSLGPAEGGHHNNREQPAANREPMRPSTPPSDRREPRCGRENKTPASRRRALRPWSTRTPRGLLA